MTKREAYEVQKISLSDTIWLYSRKEKISLLKIAKDLGYKPITFYAKMKYGRWKVEDLEKIKKHLGISIDKVLEG